MERIHAVYRIETAFDPEAAAAAMAGEQSSGTFVAVPGETEELKARFAARVERVTRLEEVSQPALPAAHTPGGRAVWHRAEVELSWPVENMGPSLPNLMSAVGGNLFELRHFSGLKLIDLVLPPAFAEAYPGPQFAVEGTRRLTGVENRPVIGTIIKPSIGLSPQQTADMVRDLAEGGIDFIKDDELIAGPPYSPLAERVRAVMEAISDHAERTGKKVMYAFNITGEIDEMLRRHDVVRDAGGTCVMFSINYVGLSGAAYFRRRCELPIHGHRNGWGAFDRSPWLGMSFVAYQKLWRLIGVDHLHVCGIRNKFCESDESVIASGKACLTPLFGEGHRPDTVMPVFSSAQWAGQAPDTFAALGSTDLIYCCGGGVVAHPGGIAAGVKSLHQAWDAAARGIPLEEHARDHAELRQAIEKFG